MEKSLRGDATHVQASTAQRAALLNASRLQSQLSGLDGGNVTAWTTADDDNIEPKTREGAENGQYLSAAAALKHLAAQNAR